jgi:exosortase
MNTIDATKTTECETPDPLVVRSAHYRALAFWVVSLAVFWKQFINLATLSFHDENSSHILLIPLISALLIYLRRKRVFCAPTPCPAIGVPLLLLAAGFWYRLTTLQSSLNETDRLSGAAALIALVWIAGFLLFYGTRSFKSAIFPLLFLLLMIPLPVVASGFVISVLQRGSADTCAGLFHLLGVPFVRHGFQFSLPGVDIEVAEQCSGIHSGLSLFIAGLLIQHVLLQETWKKICFTLCIFPIAIFKNAVRIVTISWLGIHVNPGFFRGALHHQGGLPFSLLALAMVAVLVWLLRHSFANGANSVTQ